MGSLVINLEMKSMFLHLIIKILLLSRKGKAYVRFLLLIIFHTEFIILINYNVTYILCRRDMLEKKLADAEVSKEEQNNILKYLEKKETEYMRLQRHKMGADDFEPLTMIGKGAFGEVCGFPFWFMF